MPDLQPAPLTLDIRSKRYRRAGHPDTEALRDLRLEFPAGSVTAVLGPSGCGKTTALRILLGLDTAFEGEVRQRPQRLGVVFQEPRLLPWRSIEANLRLAAEAAGRPSAQVAPLLERVGLGGWGSRFPGELSLGMARRAALARALVVDPELLVLDEPLVSLDEATAVRLRALLGEVIAERGITTVLVTHQLEDALALADRIAVLGRPPHSLRGVLENRKDHAGGLDMLRAELSRRFPEPVGQNTDVCA
ncbi:ABC transporter ATP-binding protein (plasmid) [Roseomonas marmotae]|uniref:ABC transporter ATP-binding protein n=1 Tax=Roseomonas marmotae TaxID=2768161 RepID=A0ABS3KAN7_9PROT|nr:ATP-binding cassette domain-containing protein [Roseomonas marmotae]MBO1074516.1 ABC transporter ATP-binding protein [Roseomonas marmotae]QTI81741.1 ABC transporter ATP-binding protein [Roseomonas marmotae]